MDAKEHADSYKRDIERLRQVRYQFIAEFKGLISKFGSMLNALETPQMTEEQRENKPVENSRSRGVDGETY
jgi:formiminotetrahydrofolate cyclodeaminase